MNKDFRLVLLGNSTGTLPPKVIDFTRYDLPAREPATLERDWSLMNVLNQKATRPQNKPIRFEDLPVDARQIILERYPRLKTLV